MVLPTLLDVAKSIGSDKSDEVWPEDRIKDHPMQGSRETGRHEIVSDLHALIPSWWDRS